MARKTNARTRRALVAKCRASTPILAVKRGPGDPHFTGNQGTPPPLNARVLAVLRNLEGRVSGVSTSARDPRPALRASTAGAQRVAREREREQGEGPERSEQAGMAPYKGRGRDESTRHRVRLAVGKNSPPGRALTPRFGLNPNTRNLTRSGRSEDPRLLAGNDLAHRGERAMTEETAHG